MIATPMAARAKPSTSASASEFATMRGTVAGSRAAKYGFADVRPRLPNWMSIRLST